MDEVEREVQRRLAERREQGLVYFGIAALAFFAGLAAFGVGLWVWWSNDCAPVLGGWFCR